MSRNLLLPSIFCLAFSLPGVAQQNNRSRSKPAQSKIYKEIERLEIEWNRSNEVSDVEAMRRMLADDSYHIGPSGRFYDKTRDVAAQTAARERKIASNSFPKFITLERRIRLFKNVAIVTGLGARLAVNGQPGATGQFRFVHVWEKRGNRWLLIVDQITAVSQPPPPTKRPVLPASKPQ